MATPGDQRSERGEIRLGGICVRGLAILVATLVVGCVPDPTDESSNDGKLLLRPYVHLIDQDFSPVSRDGLEVESTVSIDDVFRPTFTSSRDRVVRSSCASSGDQRTCSLALPKSLDGAFARIGKPTDADEAFWVHLTRESPTAQVASGKDARPQFAPLYAAPALEDRTIVSSPVEIPDQAELRFWIGIEMPAWNAKSPPVRFSVFLRDGSEDVPLFEESLDASAVASDRVWHDRSVPLERWSGRTARFVFRSEATTGAGAGTSLPVWGDPTVFAPAPRREGTPWVVLLSLDTMRARSMSLYGHENETTPYLEQLSAEGTLFARAFTTFPKTHGSHMSAFTSLLPHHHGMYGPVNQSRRRGDRPPKLAERLRAAGWRTAAFTENGLLDGATFSRGFDYYEESKFVPEERGEARETFARTLNWLEPRRDEGPFYVFVHTYEVHAPYAPPEEYRGLWPEIELDGLRRYEQEARVLDDLLREFLPRLQSLAGDDGLLLVIFADHGEEFFEHGSVDHARLFDEVMHVPLFFWWPGHIADHRVVEELVSLTDIAPTVLSLVGLSPFGYSDGTSLVPLMQAEPSDLRREIVYGQIPPSIGNGKRWQFVARSARGKCFASALPEESFCVDLEADPAEMRRLDVDESHPLAGLRRKVERYRDEAEPIVTEAQLRMKSRKVAPPVDRERQRKLKALGYIDDE